MPHSHFATTEAGLLVDDDDDDSRIGFLWRPTQFPTLVLLQLCSAMRVWAGASERFLVASCLLASSSLAKVDSASQNKNEKRVPRPIGPQVLIVA